MGSAPTGPKAMRRSRSMCWRSAGAGHWRGAAVVPQSGGGWRTRNSTACAAPTSTARSKNSRAIPKPSCAAASGAGARAATSFATCWGFPTCARWRWRSAIRAVFRWRAPAYRPSRPASAMSPQRGWRAESARRSMPPKPRWPPMLRAPTAPAHRLSRRRRAPARRSLLDVGALHDLLVARVLGLHEAAEVLGRAAAGQRALPHQFAAHGVLPEHGVEFLVDVLHQRGRRFRGREDAGPAHHVVALEAGHLVEGGHVGQGGQPLGAGDAERLQPLAVHMRDGAGADQHREVDLVA